MPATVPVQIPAEFEGLAPIPVQFDEGRWVGAKPRDSARDRRLVLEGGGVLAVLLEELLHQLHLLLVSASFRVCGFYMTRLAILKKYGNEFDYTIFHITGEDHAV